MFKLFNILCKKSNLNKLICKIWIYYKIKTNYAEYYLSIPKSKRQIFIAIFRSNFRVVTFNLYVLALICNDCFTKKIFCLSFNKIANFILS